MYTRKDLETLSDEQLIAIANVLEPREDWVVSRKYVESQRILEVVARTLPDDNSAIEGIVQLYFGDEHADDDVRQLIKHFDDGLFESAPNEEELVTISNIIKP